MQFLRSMTPGTVARANLIFDLTLLVCVVVYGSELFAGHIVASVGAGLAATWLLVSTALRHYDPAVVDRTASEDAALVGVLVLAMTTCLTVIDLLIPDTTGILRVGPFVLFFLPIVLSARLLVFRALWNKGKPLDEVLIVGVGAIGRITGEDIQKRNRHRILGYLKFPEEGQPRKGLEVLGDVSQLETVLRAHPVNEVYIAGNSRKHNDEMQAAIKVCEKLGMPFALPAYDFRLERARPVQATDGYVHFASVDSRSSQMAFKRMFDILLTVVALWLLLPLFVTIALLVKITSRGPIFFKQQRVGLHGRRFNMLKFRSMVVNAEELKQKLMAHNEQTGPVFKMQRDPRITAIGRFIRKYSIDELPQLINVLRGDMSVVGPRPPVPQEVEQYEAWQLRRLSVRPGLTCIWQVSGRNQISFEQWMYLDMQYIDHWSLKQDFNLIFKTVPVVFTGRGAS